MNIYFSCRSSCNLQRPNHKWSGTSIKDLSRGSINQNFTALLCTHPANGLSMLLANVTLQEFTFQYRQQPTIEIQLTQNLPRKFSISQVHKISICWMGRHENYIFVHWCKKCAHHISPQNSSRRRGETKKRKGRWAHKYKQIERCKYWFTPKN